MQLRQRMQATTKSFLLRYDNPNDCYGYCTNTANKIGYSTIGYLGECHTGVG